MMRIFLFLVLICISGAVKAAEFDQTEFAKLPVQHEGRIKPMDTFARAMLENFSGHESLNGMSAEEWMVESLFDPAQAMQRPVFRIFRPEILGLARQDKRYYAFAEIMPVLQKRSGTIEELYETNPKNWTEDQRELVRLWETTIIYTELLRSFSYILPLNIVVPPALAKAWGLPADAQVTVQQLRQHGPALQKALQDIVRRKGDDLGIYTDEERAVADLAMSVQMFEATAQNNILLRIVPGTGSEWFSPSQLTQEGEGSPAGAAYLDHWNKMAGAYQNGDTNAWRQAVKAAWKQSDFFADQDKLRLEIAYNKTRPLLLAGILYFAAFLGSMFFLLRAQNTARLLSLAALWAGGLLHAGAIAARVIILDRPPVGTLYESIIFVALICVIVAIILEHIRKDGQGILLGALAALLLLFIAGSFADGDTMKMLVAVLNTNFWLSTHVLCITMGYAWCVIASLLAHTWLIRTAMGRSAGDLIVPTKIIALTGLLFTAVGTILGGIWADQSWGRFWGWDPKENGALLIVLWLIWIFHGQLGGHLKMPAFMSGLAALSVVVALAWFGVNLLSVGLHSYGFITGVAASLGAFCAAEMLLIGYLWHRAGRPRQTA